MALSDTISQFAGRAPAQKNRVDILLDRLEGTADGDTLKAALRDKSIRHATLASALRSEYGKDAATDHSVGEWRRRNLADVDGL